MANELDTKPVLVSRNRNVLQVQIMFATEDEASAQVQRILNEIREHGWTSIKIVGTLDEGKPN